MLLRVFKVLITSGFVFGSLGLTAGEAMKSFNELDADGNGYISKSEATARADLREQWNTVDADKDGKLTESEFSAFETIPRDQPFSGQ